MDINLNQREPTRAFESHVKQNKPAKRQSELEQINETDVYQKESVNIRENLVKHYLLLKQKQA